MTIQDITCFMKLAETLNFTKTAEAMFISQPAVTRHIHSLEAELGFKLLDRSVRRNVVLTEAGQIYYRGLKKCSDSYQSTLKKILDMNVSSPLVINLLRGVRYPDSYVKATTNFMQENPSFRHFTNFIDADRIETVLERGEIVLCLKDYLPNDRHLKVMKMTKEPVPHCIIASKSHNAFMDDGSLDKELLQETTLFLPKDLPASLKSTYLSYMEDFLGKLPEEIMYLDSMDSVILFLRSGRCFAICDQWYSETRSSELRTHTLALASDYYAVWNPDAVTNPFVESYLKILQ